MIETSHLTKRYGDLTAVDGLNLRVDKGEIYGFLGPNGAGKTTTIMMLLGLLEPTTGEVKLFGTSLASDYFNIKRKIGVLSESQYLYEEMTARECLRFFGELYRVENVERRIDEVLELVNLRDRADDLLRGYSKGMKQKFGLARALLHDPEVLFLDEPVANLDPYGIKEVRDIIMAENERGRTIFISSHILSEIERTCHRVGIIHKGRLLAEDRMDDLKRRLMDEVQLDLELESPSEGVLEALRSLPYVLDVEGSGRHLTVKTKADNDYRGQISQAVSQSGGVLLGLRRRELSLEEAFVTITENNLSLLTKEGPAA